MFSSADLRPIAERAAVTGAKTLGRLSRLWNQRGLGTMFRAIGSVPHLAKLRAAVEFEPELHFETEIFEPYWGPVVFGGRAYEPELRHTLERLLDRGTTFIDGGANYGYWSIIATRPDGGTTRAVAVEPSPSTFRGLQINCTLNRDRFVCAKYALDTESGRTRTLMQTDAHAIAKLATDDDAVTGESVEVETITIDDLLAKLGWDDAAPFVVKLDVEGAEIPAITGAKASRARADHALIVEDWPGARYKVAEFLFAEGYSLFHISPEGRATRLSSVEHALRFTSGNGGHRENFVAIPRPGPMMDTLVAWSEERG